MDYKGFYDDIRDVFALTNENVSGFDFIISEGLRRDTPLNHMAYILATVWHETASTMQPIAEYNRGRGRKYGKPQGPYGKIYYGRGYVQLTWLFNYEYASKKLGVDFVRNPEKVMEKEHAVKILFQGMKEGWFTKKNLDDYIDLIDEDDKEDLREFSNARRIINGTDKQVMIGQYALVFERALRENGYEDVTTKDIDTTIYKTPKKKTVTELIVGFLKLMFGRE